MEFDDTRGEYYFVSSPQKHIIGLAIYSRARIANLKAAHRNKKGPRLLESLGQISQWKAQLSLNVGACNPRTQLLFNNRSALMQRERKSHPTQLAARAS
jgi:hypothetical protein